MGGTGCVAGLGTPEESVPGGWLFTAPTYHELLFAECMETGQQVQ